MMYRTFSRYILVASILLFSACSQNNNDPEEQIKKLVSTMESAVEKRSIDEIKEHIDDEYSDEWNGSRRAALRALMFYYQGHQSIHLLTKLVDIKFNEDSTAATAIVYVGMAGEPVEESASLLDINADLYRFEIELIADDGNWLVRSAKWQRARPDNIGL